MSDLDLKRMIGAALMVPPTDNWHYPLSENQLHYLITQAVEAEREACARVCEQEALLWPQSKDFRLCAAAIRARGQ